MDAGDDPTEEDDLLEGLDLDGSDGTEGGADDSAEEELVADTEAAPEAAPVAAGTTDVEA